MIATTDSVITTFVIGGIIAAIGILILCFIAAIRMIKLGMKLGKKLNKYVDEK